VNGKVGEGGRGRNEGYGKWVELADLPTLHISIYTQAEISMVSGINGDHVTRSQYI